MYFHIGFLSKRYDGKMVSKMSQRTFRIPRRDLIELIAEITC